jgi:hypothetical protein
LRSIGLVDCVAGRAGQLGSWTRRAASAEHRWRQRERFRRSLNTEAFIIVNWTASGRCI